MKKKLTALALVAVIAFSATACGSAKVNETNAWIGEDIIQTVDNYLDGYIDAQTACDTVYLYYSMIDESDPDAAYQSILSSYAILISTELNDMAWGGSGDLNKIKRIGETRLPA